MGFRLPTSASWKLEVRLEERKKTLSERGGRKEKTGKERQERKVRKEGREEGRKDERKKEREK